MIRMHFIPIWSMLSIIAFNAYAMSPSQSPSSFTSLNLYEEVVSSSDSDNEVSSITGDDSDEQQPVLFTSLPPSPSISLERPQVYHSYGRTAKLLLGTTLSAAGMGASILMTLIAQNSTSDAVWIATAATWSFIGFPSSIGLSYCGGSLMRTAGSLVVRSCYDKTGNNIQEQDTPLLQRSNKSNV